MKVNNQKNEIKALIIKEGFSIKQIADTISEITGENISQQNLNNKINREQLRYSDILLISNILGYDIEWVKKEILNNPENKIKPKEKTDTPDTRPTSMDYLLQVDKDSQQAEKNQEVELIKEFLGKFSAKYKNEYHDITTGKLTVSMFFNTICNDGSYSDYLKFKGEK